MSIGKLESVPLRQVWKSEQGFSEWLENNIDMLSEAIGISLRVVEREKRAGAFQADLVAEDDHGNLVIIENQLEPTNHDHLGKVLTYLTNLEAKTAIWISSDPRPEHIRSTSWLNESTPDDISLYLVRIAGYRIGGSDPAPLFTAIVAPSAESKDIGKTRRDLAERQKLRLKFWEQLLTRAKEKGVTTHAGRSPGIENCLGAGAGKSGLAFNYLIWLEGKTAVELYIDTGDAEQNNRTFDLLYAKKEEIEAEFGDALLWEGSGNRRASRIRFFIYNGGLKDNERNWSSIQDAMIDAMARLSKALKSHIQAMSE